MSQISVISGLQMGLRAPKTAILWTLPRLGVTAEEMRNARSKVKKETGLIQKDLSSNLQHLFLAR